LESVVRENIALRYAQREDRGRFGAKEFRESIVNLHERMTARREIAQRHLRF
jgi:hypothetical protein